MSDKHQPVAIKVFYSYAHEDEDWRKRLDRHFSFLKREEKVASWYDGELKAGEKWRGKIDEHLNTADVILLLISAAFADSEFCYSVEMERAMERHQAGEAVVVPILLHPCDWHNAPFAELQALPGDAKAISEWQHTERALYEVARGIRKVVEDLIGKRVAKRPNDPSQPQLNASSAVQQSKQPSQSGDDNDYRPDETERGILAYLFKDGVDRTLGSIVKALNFAHSEEAKFHLERLIKYHYIDRPDRTRPSLPRDYSIRQEGREFVIQNNLHKEVNDQDQVLALPLRQRSQPQTTETPQPAAAYEPDETAIDILKQIAKGNSYESQIAEVLKLNAVQVRISLSQLSQHDYIKLVTPSSLAPYYQLTDKGRAYLDKPHYKAPHPSRYEGYKPDAEAEKILLLVADPDADHHAYYFAVALTLHPERVKHHLGLLERNGYVLEHLNLYEPPEYSLTDKARRFLMDKGHF